MAPVSSSQSNPKWLFNALNGAHAYPFEDLFDITHPVALPPDLVSDNGVLVLWGGGDISPSLYNQKPSKHTGADSEPSKRDYLEVALAGHAIKRGIPILGICRGAQLLCSMAGGKLVQHVNGHGRAHYITTDEGKSVHTTSLHHQMMYPWDTNHKLIAWTSEPQSNVYIGAELDTKEDEYVIFPESVGVKREPEIVYFPEIKGLGIQGHPEFIANEEHAFIVYSKDLIRRYLIEPFLK